MGNIYYVKNGGSDSADGLSDANAWATISRADNLSGNQSDNSVLFKRGGTWREQWTLVCSGTSGHPFTIGAYDTGALPRILGSDQVTGWTPVGDGVRWVATHAITSGASDHWMYFVNTNGTIKWGDKQTSIANCTNEYDYYGDGTSVYCWTGGSTSGYDPDTRYASLEHSMLQYGLQRNGQKWITVNDIEFGYQHDQGIMCEYGSAGEIGWIVDGCTMHHIGEPYANQADGIMISNSNVIVRNCTIYDAGDHGVGVTSGAAGRVTEYVTIEDNIIYNCYHTGIDIMSMASGATLQHIYVRRNLVYSNSDYAFPTYTCNGIYPSNPGTWADIVISYNIVINMPDSGIKCYQCQNVTIENNVVYGYLSVTGTHDNAHYYTGSSGGISGIILKNNIGMDTRPGDWVFSCAASAAISACDNNCWYQSAGGSAVYASVNGATYHYNDFAAYKTATGWDTNGFWEDPHFVNVGGDTADDYKLVSDSPLVDKGASVGLTEDYWGTSVPQGSLPDIGAYEYPVGGAGTPIIEGWKIELA